MQSETEKVSQRYCLCIFCTVDNSLSRDNPELWCDNEKSPHNNGMDIKNEYDIGIKCPFFKNRNIEKRYDGIFSIRQSEFKNGKRYIVCESDNYNLLNDFVSLSEKINYEKRKIEKREKELKDIIDFIKSELPEVYTKLRKEFKKRKGSMK